MSCIKPTGACGCVGPHLTFPAKAYCEHWVAPEREVDQVSLDSIAAFGKLPTSTAKVALAHLRQSLASRPEILERWRDQKKRGVRIGSDDIRFHFGAGMAVRNILRQVVKDHKLPSGNWDDYYYGALDALVKE